MWANLWLRREYRRDAAYSVRYLRMPARGSTSELSATQREFDPDLPVKMPISATWLGKRVSGGLGRYTAIAASLVWRSPGGFSTLEGVGTLFSNPWLLLAGWVHYLAFDLLVGSWQLQDARERGISRLLVIPCFTLTFLFGPAGWLLYIVMRSIRTNGSH